MIETSSSKGKVGDLSKALYKILNADSVAILGHPHPDLDAVASAYLFYYLRSKMGKASYVLMPHDPPDNALEILKWLKLPLPIYPNNRNHFVPENFEVLVAVEMGSEKRLKMALSSIDLAFSYSEVVNIDHHASNEGFGSLYYIDPEAPSNTSIIYQGMKLLNISLDEISSLLILMGLMGDTNLMTNPNVTPEVLRTTADLMSNLKKYKWSDLVKLLKAKSVKGGKLACLVVERATDRKINGILVRGSFITRQDFIRFNAKPADAEKLVEELFNYLPIPDITILARYDFNLSGTKVSLRSGKTEIDVGSLALRYGGGGHRNAAGFSSPKSPEEILNELFKALDEYLVK